MNNMKKLLLIFLVFISFASYGQRIQKANTYGLAFNRTGADTLFYLPSDTFTVPAAYLTYPFMARKGANVYIWNTSSNVWQGLTGGTLDTTGAFITSVYRRSDSVFYVKGGVHTFAFIDSTGVGIPTLQQVLTAGSTLTGGNTIDANNNDFSIDNVGEFLQFRSTYNGTHNLFMNEGIDLETSFSGKTSSISLQSESITIRPSLDSLFIDSLHYTLSTTGKKILIRDTATGLVQNIDPSLLGASSYTFTNGLTESGGTVKLGGTLTEPITVLDGGVTNNLRFQDMQFEVTNSNTLMLGDSISLTGGATPNRLSVIILKNDTIKINPGLGLLFIDTLAAASNMTNKRVMTWDTVTKRWEQIAKDSVGGGGTAYVDSVYINGSNDSLIVQRNGNRYASLLPSTGGGDTLTYSSNPSEWVTLKSPNNPVINSDMYTPNPLVEHTQYAPSPIIAWDGNVWNYVKGDGYNAISVYKSTDRGESFNFIDTVIVPRSGTYYSQSATIPGVVADSANNLIHIYFQALDLAVTPDVMSIGYATAPYNDPSNVTISDPLITPADFVTQTGITYQPGYLNITSVVKTDSIYYFGTFWDGNADHPTGDFKIFMGSSDTWDTIRNCRVILSPTAPYDLVRSPSVFLDNGLYKMIYTNGYIDNDSLTTLVSAYSSNLKAWTPYNGTLLSVGESGSWEEKRVYMAQVLKKSTGTFADPYFFPKENYGYPANDNYTDAIKYYYSGSNNDSPVYSDFTGLAYLYPQRGKEDFFISEADTNVSVINRNTTHVINIPNASDSTTGKLKSEDWTTFNNKAPGSGSTNYIQNKSATVGTAQASASFHIADSATIGKVLHVGGNSTSLYALNVNANVGVTNLAGLRIYNSGYGSRDWYWQINASTGEIAHGATGTSGSYTLGSFASGMLWQSSYWRWRANQSPFNYIFEIDGGVNNAVNIVPSAGKLAVGGYTKDSTMTLTGSLRVSSNVKFGGKVHAPSLGSGNGTKAVRWDATNGLVLADTNTMISNNTYTPTLYNTTNVAASSAFPCFYTRIGDYVYVWGEVEIDATTSLTVTELGMSLPIATSITNSPELAGTAAHEDNTTAQVKGDPTNDRAKFRLTPQTNTANVYSFHFSYKYVAP